MAQVSIGQVENLEALARELTSLRDGVNAACLAQISLAEAKCTEAREEAQASALLLEEALQRNLAATQAVEEARQELDQCAQALDAAHSALSACNAQPHDDQGIPPDCSDAESDVSSAEAGLEQAQILLTQAESALESSRSDCDAMHQRVDQVGIVLSLTQSMQDSVVTNCTTQLVAIDQAVAVGTARLGAAQQALDAYLATSPTAAQFHDWLKWDPTRHAGPITPDVLRNRMNLSSQQRMLFQQYLYDRDPAYRGAVNKFRAQWTAAQGDVERNIVARQARRQLSGEFGEQIARYALAPLGEKIETQGRTFVGDDGRYTKTDLLVTDLRIPVILGRGEGMGAPKGGSMAFEVKCGKAEYLYAQMAHMVFQAEGHQQANARCTLCSRDINNLSPERQEALRQALRKAGSPLVGMLPTKNDIDQSCLEAIRQDSEETV